MTATNHALTGAIIGLAVANPSLAIPVAFLSHFVCDAVPHFGAGKAFITTTPFKILLITDAILCFLLVLTLALTHPPHWQLAALCAFIATSPDFWSIREFIRSVQGRPYAYGRVKRFMQRIQWFERPIGAVVEIVYFAATLATLITLIKK